MTDINDPFTDSEASDSGNDNGFQSTILDSPKFKFHGNNLEYLGLIWYNVALTIVTLGIYYPWAKCAIRKYYYQETELAGSRFDWHGTGNEMFRGFIKAYLILGGLLLIINFGNLFIPMDIFMWVVLLAYLGILAFVPLAIHGMVRYRASRSSFRGIHFGYRGDLKEFYKKVIADFLLTIVTIGIYGSWLRINIRRYVLGHTRFGNVEARFDAEGGEFFALALGQGILTAITLYLYLPWAMVEFFKFDVENSVLIHDDQEYRFESSASGWQFVLVLLKAGLITVFTLGLGAPVGQLMIHRFWTESVSLKGEFDISKVQQTEEAYTDAMGDDMADMLDFDF